MYWDMTKEGINKLRVKNGDNIKGLDKSVAVKEGVYITVGEGVAKEPKEGAVQTTNIKVEKPTNSNPVSSGDSSTSDNNSKPSSNKTQNPQKTKQNNNNKMTLIIIIISVVIFVITCVGICTYFFAFKKKK